MARDQFNFESVKAALDREIKRAGTSPTNLSQRVRETNKSLVKNILDTGDDIKLSTLCALADKLEINVARLIPWAQSEPETGVSISVESLEAILVEVLKNAPGQTPLTAQSRTALAAGLASGLELLGANLANPASPDALVVASRGAVRRFRELAS